MKDRPEKGRNEDRQWAAVQSHVGSLHRRKSILIAILIVLFTLSEGWERNEGQELDGQKSKWLTWLKMFWILPQKKKKKKGAEIFRFFLTRAYWRNSICQILPCILLAWDGVSAFLTLQAGRKQISGSPGEGLGGGELAASSTISGQPRRKLCPVSWNIRCWSPAGGSCHSSLEVDESVTFFKQQTLKLLQRAVIAEDRHGHP